MDVILKFVDFFVFIEKWKHLKILTEITLKFPWNSAMRILPEFILAFTGSSLVSNLKP